MTLTFCAVLLMCTGAVLATWLLSDQPLVQIQVLAVMPVQARPRPGRVYVRVVAGGQ